MVALYGDDGFKTIQEFQSVLKDIDNAIIKGGMEDLEVIARNNVFVSSVGRILGTKVAAATGGPALVFAGIGGRVANALISKKSAKQIKALVGEAFTDADFAADLLRPYVADQQEVVSRAVNTFIVNAFGEQVREEVMPEIQQEPEEQSSSMNITDVRPVNQVSRLSNANIANPVGMMPTPTADTGPTGKVDSRTASMLFPDDKIFTPDTFAAQGGIMNARKPIQRVA